MIYGINIQLLRCHSSDSADKKNPCYGLEFSVSIPLRYKTIEACFTKSSQNFGNFTRNTCYTLRHQNWIVLFNIRNILLFSARSFQG